MICEGAGAENEREPKLKPSIREISSVLFSPRLSAESGAKYQANNAQNMDSVFHLDALAAPPLLPLATATATATATHRLPCLSISKPHGASSTSFRCFSRSAPLLRLRGSPIAASNTLTANSVPPRSGVYTVGDFMTRKEDLHAVKPTTSVDEALEILVEHRITGFPVIDDDWKLVGVVSDYDLLALDSISGHGQKDNSLFPEVDSTWKTFNEVQKLLSKTKGKVIGELMTPAPMVVRETTNLEDAARLLLETKFRRLPVVDAEGKLVGIITRGNVVRAALQIKRASEMESQ